MNKIKTLYPTQIPYEQNPLRDNYNNFKKRIEQNIKHTIALKKIEHVQQSTQLMDKLNNIKRRSDRYKKKYFEQEQEFQNKVVNEIKYDIKKYEDYEEFFKGMFEKLEGNMDQLKKGNRMLKRKIEEKVVSLKTLRRKQAIELFSEDKESLTNYTPNTKQSSVRLSYSNSNSKRLKTDSSLPQLKPIHRSDRIKTLQTEYQESPKILQKSQRSLSYMQPIGLVRGKQKSRLSVLGELLDWYKMQQNPQDSWFLKLLYNQRHYGKLKTYIERHSGERKIVFHK